MPKIFISYRRGISSGWAGRLSQTLRSKFGDQSVYMDIESNSPGVDFHDAVNKALNDCDCVIALISPDWLTVADQAGGRRLDNPDDWVRRELATALTGRAQVIPVLVGGARTPKVDDLPEPLRDLTRRQALELTDARWDFDCGKLTRAIAPEARTLQRRTWQFVLSLATAGVLVVAATWLGLWPFVSTRSLLFTVNAFGRWQDSNFLVGPVEEVTVSYVGGAWRGTNTGELVDPRTIRPHARTATPDCVFPVPEAEAGSGALVARIGENGKAFDALLSTGTGEGTVRFRMNDCDTWLEDNDGSVTVRITVRSFLLFRLPRPPRQVIQP